LLRRISRDAETVVVLDGAVSWQGITPDCRTLITTGAARADEKGPALLVWDIADVERRVAEPGRIPFSYADLEMPLLADSRTMVFRQDKPSGDRVAVVWDVAKHGPLGEIALTGAEGLQLVACPGHDLFVLYGAPGGPRRLTVYRARPLTRLWERDCSDDLLQFVEFLRESDLVLAHTGREGRIFGLHLLDMRTGETRLVLRPRWETYVWNSGGHSFMLSEIERPGVRERGFFAKVLEWCRATFFASILSDDKGFTTTRVFDTTSGVEILRLRRSGQSRSMVVAGRQITRGL
jgi:hypothetical protein